MPTDVERRNWNDKIIKEFRANDGRVGAPFEGGGYYVTRVKHTFDNVHGLRTRFEAERATVNEVA